MSFPESLKLDVRRKAHFTCCMCKALGVEVHHIVPQAEGGPNTMENAAPLCPSCHEIYGANPTKRKLIKEVRDLWYEICATRYSGDPNTLDNIYSMLGGLATKDDISRLIISNRTGSSTQYPAEVVPWEHLKFSFEREEFVHPLIVRELLGWISDAGHPVAAVDIGLANSSNRFHGEFSRIRQDDKNWLQWKGQGGEIFSYSFIACSPSGVQMVECHDCGGGSGVFGWVGLFAFESDRCLATDARPSMSGRTRLLLKILGTIPLGDRYSGSITYRNGQLSVGPDVGWFARGDDACAEIPIE